jgi:hypothetical protein
VYQNGCCYLAENTPNAPEFIYPVLDFNEKRLHWASVDRDLDFSKNKLEAQYCIRKSRNLTAVLSMYVYTEIGPYHT